jgi:hypothetical protein
MSFISNLEKFEFHGVVGSCHVNVEPFSFMLIML